MSDRLSAVRVSHWTGAVHLTLKARVSYTVSDFVSIQIAAECKAYIVGIFGLAVHFGHFVIKRLHVYPP